MHLIADSGSTTTTWSITSADNNGIYKTTGINPFFLTQNEISDLLKKELASQIDTDSITKIFFYGAGCSSEKRCEVVRQGIKEVFKNTEEITVDHDLLGAARALCQHEAGIATILGTGSNSCYYDGKEVIENVPALGFIMGDEGSGAYMGKKLIRAHIYKELPTELSERFDLKYKLDKNEILDTVYKQPHPNRFLASFSRFLSENIEHKFISELVYECFNEFIISQVLKYDLATSLKMNSVGSIAFTFSGILEQAVRDNGIEMGIIVQDPIQKLIEFHS
ncbi:MAG: hypothetical protein IIA45_00205 [Bacteroidetes bacterium]|nr:hypothetical protein [Bacteroidota bacterium]